MAQYQVQGPDGQMHVIEGPDGASDSDVIAAAKRMIGPTKELQGLDLVKQRAGHLVRDFGRGTLKTLDTIGEGISSFNDADRPRARSQPSPGVADTLIPPRVPTGQADDLMRAMTEGAGGSMIGPGAVARPLLTLGTGALSGLGSRLGENATGGSPIGSMVGSLLGGSIPMAGSAIANARNAPALAREVLKGTDETNLDIARRRMVEAKSILPSGINLSQAMGTPSNIDDIVEALSKSSEGAQVARQLRNQPEQLLLLSKVAQGGLPGVRQSEQTVANRAQDSATKAIQGLYDERSAVMDPLLKKAPQLAETGPQNLSNIVNAARFKDNVSPSLAEELKVLEGRLSLSPTTEAPNRSPQYIEGVLRDFRKGIEPLSLTMKDPVTRSQKVEVLKQLEESLGSMSPATGLAHEVGRDYTTTQIDPLKKGIVGQIAGVRGATEGRAATVGKLRALFERGTPDPKSSEIAALEASLRKQDPTLFPDAVKSYIGDVLDKVTPVDGARVAEDFGAQVKSALAGTPAQRQGLQDMLAGVARSHGVAEGPVVKGFMNFIDAATLASRRPPKVSGLSPEGIEEIAGKSKVAGVLTSLGPGRLGTKVSSWYSKDARSTIDKLLTTPEGLDKLRLLSKEDPSSQRAQILISTMLGEAGSAGEKPTQ